MERQKVYRAIGLMSGTSLDGVDAALIETDGYDYIKPLEFVSLPYEAALREQIRGLFGRREGDPAVEKALTRKHVEAVKILIGGASPLPNPLPEGRGDVCDVIGFHGQTITHDPANKFTLQIGDAKLLAQETGMNVVSDFRSADVQAGGEGAPLLPLYHRARAVKLPKPIAVLNIGGVANVTWVGDGDILAFDTGPGNAMVDDFILQRTGGRYDADGAFAAKGKILEGVIKDFLSHSYFSRRPPKSLDRHGFKISLPSSVSVEDGATTLTAATVRAVVKGTEWFAAPPKQWLVTGGGRHNGHMMRELQKALGAPVKTAEAFGWNGDALEAEGFGYLAVRSLLGEPLSLPETTGVPEPMSGGRLYKN